jgi:hypothetical protein
MLPPPTDDEGKLEGFGTSSFAKPPPAPPANTALMTM